MRNPQSFLSIQRWRAPHLLEYCPCQILCDMLLVEQSTSLLLRDSWHGRSKKVRAKMLSVIDWIHGACLWLWVHTLLQKIVSAWKVLGVLCSELWCSARWWVWNLHLRPWLSVCLWSLQICKDFGFYLKRFLCRNASQKCLPHVRISSSQSQTNICKYFFAVLLNSSSNLGLSLSTCGSIWVMSCSRLNLG